MASELSFDIFSISNLNDIVEYNKMNPNLN
jgi:hypothetical protein